MDCYYPYTKASLDDYSHLYASHSVCNCLPACNAITYSFDVHEKIHEFSYEESAHDYELIEFKYKDSEYYPLIRYQEFKTQDFLSYIGGLLGLFAGF